MSTFSQALREYGECDSDSPHGARSQVGRHIGRTRQLSLGADAPGLTWAPLDSAIAVQLLQPVANMKTTSLLAFGALLLSSCAMTAHEIVYVAEASGGA